MEENFGHFWQDFTLQMRKFLVFLVEENPGIAYIEFCTQELVEDLAKSCNPFLIFLSPPKNISAVFFFIYIELFLSFPTHSQAGIHTRTHTHTHPQNYLVKNLVKISPLNIRVYQQVNSVGFRVSTWYFEIYCFVNNVSIVILLCHHLLTLDMWETLWCHKFMNIHL